MPRIMLMVMALGLGVLLTACSVEEPAQPAVPPVTRRPEATPAVLQTPSSTPEDEPPNDDTSSRRDPFKPLIEAAKPPPPKGPEQANCPPTQEFELASLKVVAIIWGEMGRKAMLKAPNGRGYTVTEDMRLGRTCGRVRRIESNAVVIEDIRHDTEGRVLEQEVVLRLREREG